jgi:cell division protein FtsQ
LRINWNYIKALLLLALVAFLYSFSYTKNIEKQVYDVQVEFAQGNNLFMDYQMVNKLLIQNGKPVKNQSKSVIDLHRLELNVRQHPMVEEVAVYLTVDGLLKTKIKQRTPIARIKVNNLSYYIDSQAKIMPLSDNHSARVMLFSGDIEEKDHDKIHELARTILEHEFLKKQIIGVQKTSNDEYILESRIGDQKINLGKIENLKQKFKNLESFFNKTMKDDSIDKYATINLKFDNQVVCTKR